MLHVKISPEMGRGIYAEGLILAGMVIAKYEILVLSPIDTQIINSTNLRQYTFKYDQDRDCLVLGLGEMFNHSDNENVSYRLVESEGRYLMRFTAIKDIGPREQLFINYKQDVPVNIASYLNKPSMIG